MMELTCFIYNFGDATLIRRILTTGSLIVMAWVNNEERLVEIITRWIDHPRFQNSVGRIMRDFHLHLCGSNTR